MPASQSAQTPETEALPAAQLAHADDETAPVLRRDVPAPQATQPVAPVPGWEVPAAQKPHAVAACEA